MKPNATMNQFWLLLICLRFSPALAQEPALTESETVNLRFLQEKVYLHTDKSYYYPGEVIWYKAYLAYGSPSVRDSLSRVLYVECIDSKKTIGSSAVLLISGGMCWGDIPLAKDLPPGKYILRAYTNWMRNYGVQYIYQKPIVILPYNENVDPSIAIETKIPAPFQIDVTSDKQTYHAREKVDIQINILNRQGQVIPSNVSVSITDMEVVVALPKSRHIMSGLLAVDPQVDVKSLEYRLEKGITVLGRVMNNKKPLNAFVNIVQASGSVQQVKTTTEGYFAVTNLTFYDSMQFTFQPVNTKGKPLGKVSLLPRDIPIVEATFDGDKLPLRSMDMAQRVQNTYTPQKDVKLLEEVVVVGQSLKADSVLTARSKLYSHADYTIRGDQLIPIGSNFLLSLQGKVPGLSITEYYDTETLTTKLRVKIRGGTSSIIGPTDPLVLVDGMLMENVNALVALTPTSVDRVEVVTRAMPQYGSRGANGLIAIYTKTGNGVVDDIESDVNTFWVNGYATPRIFPMPDYETSTTQQQPDFRSTLYWNPNVPINKEAAHISFYTSDLPGRYRIDIEGLTKIGIPVKAEAFLVVE